MDKQKKPKEPQLRVELASTSTAALPGKGRQGVHGFVQLLEKPNLAHRKKCKYFTSESTLDSAVFSFAASREPRLKDLHNTITPFFAREWKNIGIQLDLNTGSLDAIEYDYPANCRQCCNKMLEEWLRMEMTPTWGKVQRALKFREQRVGAEIQKVDLPMPLTETQNPFKGSSCRKLYQLLVEGTRRLHWQALEEECVQLMKTRLPIITKVLVCMYRLITSVMCVRWDEAETLVAQYLQLKQLVKDPVALLLLETMKEYSLGYMSRNKSNFEEAQEHKDQAVSNLFCLNREEFPMEFLIVNGLDISLQLDKMEHMLNRDESSPKFSSCTYIQQQQVLLLKLDHGLGMTSYFDEDNTQLYQCFLLLKKATVYLHTYSRATLPESEVEITPEDMENASDCLLMVQKIVETLSHSEAWWVIFQGHITAGDYHYHKGNLDEAHESVHKVFAIGNVHDLFDSWSVERKRQWIQTRRSSIQCTCDL